MKDMGRSMDDTDISHDITTTHLYAIMRVAYQLHVRNADVICSTYGISFSQLRILLLLKFTKNPLKIVDLAGFLNQNANNISMIIDRMVKQRLVSRIKSKQDRRIVTVKLADKGLNMIHNCWPEVMQTSGKGTSILSDTEMQNLIAILEKLAKNLIECGEEGSITRQMPPYNWDMMADYLKKRIRE